MNVHPERPLSPPATIVVPAHGRSDLLLQVLEGFAREAEEEAFELVLVDDGSEPALAPALGELARAPWLRLERHPENLGRAAALNTGIAAARGVVVILCDSDVVPQRGFVREHLDFHRAHTGMHATHLGALGWGIEPTLLGSLLGPRGNPRVSAARGPVDWTVWYTDNWSFKRRLFSEHGLAFDPAFRAWGWEELELARRLVQLGVTSEAGGRALGLHLKAPTRESFTRNFERSVPNLLRLARGAPADPAVRGWLSCQVHDAGLLARMESALDLLWERVEDLDRRTADSTFDEASLHAVVRGLGVAFSDAFFRFALARGFAAEAAAGSSAEGIPLPPTSDAEQVLALSTPLAQVVLGEALLLAQPDAQVLVEAVLERLALPPALAERLLHRVETEIAASARALQAAA